MNENNCLNDLKIMGNPQKLNNLKNEMIGLNFLTQEKELICWTNYITNIENLNIKLLNEKYTFFDVSIDDESSKKCLNYKFISNNYPPIDLLMIISKKHPSLDFSLSFFNPCLSLKGKMNFRNGIKILEIDNNGRLINNEEYFNTGFIRRPQYGSSSSISSSSSG